VPAVCKTIHNGRHKYVSLQRKIVCYNLTFIAVENVQPNPQILIDIVQTRMPFGKYKGTFIADLPVYYLEWMSSKGFSKDKMGHVALHHVRD
jgi:uncharacterized protein (DUF3820 family)